MQPMQVISRMLLWITCHTDLWNVYLLYSFMRSYFCFSRFYYLNFTVDELSGKFIAYFYERKTDLLLKTLNVSNCFQAKCIIYNI